MNGGDSWRVRRDTAVTAVSGDIISELKLITDDATADIERKMSIDVSLSTTDVVLETTGVSLHFTQPLLYERSAQIVHMSRAEWPSRQFMSRW